MFAADTNILIRFITDDDIADSPRARRLIAEHDIHVGVTVVLEAAWVLGKTYGMPQTAVVLALGGFLGLPRVTVEAKDEIHRALRWAEEGMDVADAIHLSLAKDADGFTTFDRRLMRQGRELGLVMHEP